MGVELRPRRRRRRRASASMFASRGRRMPDNNLRQAMVPVGATVIPQTRGTAPGLICPRRRQGHLRRAGRAPRDVGDGRAGRAARPAARGPATPRSIVSRVLRTWGESESGLDERLRPVIDRLDARRQPDARLPGQRLGGAQGAAHGQGRDRGRGRALLGRRGRRGPRRCSATLVFGIDDDTMESVVLDLLRERGLTLGLAESVTGGLVAARLTDVPGASDVLRGSVVSLRQRGEVRPARRAARARWSPRTRPWRWPRARGGCSVPTSAWRSPGSPARPSRTGCRLGTLYVGLALGRGVGGVAPAARPARADAPVLGDHRARPAAASAPGRVSGALSGGSGRGPCSDSSGPGCSWRSGRPAGGASPGVAPARPQPGVRWVPPEQWHVTLRFLGTLGAGSRRCVVEAVRCAEGFGGRRLNSCPPRPGGHRPPGRRPSLLSRRPSTSRSPASAAIPTVDRFAATSPWLGERESAGRPAFGWGSPWNGRFGRSASSAAILDEAVPDTRRSRPSCLGPVLG